MFIHRHTNLLDTTTALLGCSGDVHSMSKQKWRSRKASKRRPAATPARPLFDDAGEPGCAIVTSLNLAWVQTQAQAETAVQLKKAREARVE